MDDARPSGRAARQGQASGHQSVDQRVIPMPWGRMHHEAGGLIDHRECLILVYDIEWNVGRREPARRLSIRKIEFDEIAPLEHARRAHGGSVDPNPLPGEQPGDLGSGKLQLVGQEAVDALRHLDQNAETDGRHR